ncbi:MFS transporter [Litorisediminicola beolgyonensis]|uniref:MFS transporter n=1 Tax=Litorisediminicola beolgyonensis TaxID=1173614 RepID=A0ABW3ZI05_9RHOB
MRAPQAVLLGTVTIDAMGVGLMIPVLPDLLREVTGSGLAQAALWGGLLSTGFSAMQFLCGPALGALSDRYGRRPILLVSLAVMAADYLVMALAATVWWLLAARLVSGVTAATQSTASAAMSDLSPPEKKSANFGLIGAAFGMGFVLGPMLGGVLGEFGTRAPFYAAAALAALNCALGWWVLPETVTDRTRRPLEMRRLNPLGAFRALNRLEGVGQGIFTFFLLQVAFFVYPAIWAYYGTARFGWSPGMIGLSLALFGIAVAFVQGGLIRVILRVLGDRGTVIYGLVFNGVAFLALALVQSGTLAMILTPLAAFGAVTSPALQGMLARVVGDDEQGALQGLFSSAAALAAIVSPPIMTAIFAAFTRPEGPYFPGAPFLASLAILGLALALVLRRG